MQLESKNRVEEKGSRVVMVASFPKGKKIKKAVMLQKGGSNIWIVPVPHDQISTHCFKRIDLQILLASSTCNSFTQKLKK